jgi:hypothetical protein
VSKQKKKHKWGTNKRDIISSYIKTTNKKKKKTTLHKKTTIELKKNKHIKQYSLERNEKHHKKKTRKRIMKLKLQSGRKEWKENKRNCSNIEEEQIITL